LSRLVKQSLLRRDLVRIRLLSLSWCVEKSMTQLKLLHLLLSNHQKTLD
jgi:hypothetical protein